MTGKRRTASKTDWQRVKAMRDAEINLSDILEIGAASAARSVVRVGGKSVPRGNRNQQDRHQKK
jgi:hypothetical protein